MPGMHVEKLGISPLKSGRYYPDHQTLWFETNGTFGDRRHMVVEAKPHTNVRYHVDEVAQPGQFLSQREDPNMAKIIAKPVFAFSLELNFEGETIVVSEKDDEESNLIDVSVWGWHGQAVDEGDEAADWMSRVMERPVRLVRASSKKPRFVEGNKDLGVVNFSDGYPLLVTSVGSIAAVNKRLVENGKSPVDHARFRPNIVLGGNDEPFIEDRIKSFEFEAGGLTWLAVRRKPCSRCVIVDKDPNTGETSLGVQKALTQLGRKGTYADIDRFGQDQKLFFGQNFRIVVPERASYFNPALLSLGDTVVPRFSEKPNWLSVER
jgi:uncharacterized protein YcbX